MIKRRLKNGRWHAIEPDGSERLMPDVPADWSRLDARSEQDLANTARSDPDAKPLSTAKLRQMRRIPLVKHLRWKLGLTQEDFATRFNIPLGTLRDWEQRRREPDATAQAYLKVIAADARFVAKAVQGKKDKEPRRA